MTRVKICGLTHPDDVRFACRAGTDALGFVMVAGSKREVAPEQARTLARVAHPFVLTVGVIADRTVDEAVALADFTGLRALQLHGSEPPELARAIKRARPSLAVFKALQLRRREDLAAMDAFAGLDGLLLDSGAGSGVPFDWSWLDEPGRAPVVRIVAGGLDSSNVGGLIARVSPEAVDVSSGVEGPPGRKDPGKVEAFLAAVRRERGFAPGRGRV